ncbi:MAG TPA: PAS domain-containing sensor histidine kinase [Drouetiella sp.]
MTKKGPNLMGKGLLIIAIPAVLQLIFGISLAYIGFKAQEAQRRETQAIQVLLLCGRIESACYTITKEVIRLTVEKSVRVIRTIHATTQSLDSSQAELVNLVQNDVVQKTNVERLLPITKSFVTNVEKIIEAIKENDQIALTMEGMKVRNSTLKKGAGEEQLATIRQVEESRLAESPVNGGKTSFILMMLSVGLLISTILALLSAAYFLRDIVFRIYGISKNAELITVGEEMKPAMEGHDEIARLDRVLHSMAKSLKDATRRETALVSNAADVILCIDKSLMITTINKAAETQWHYPEADLLHKRIMSLIPSESQEEVRNFFASAKNTRNSETADIPIICSDSRIKTFSWNVLWSPEEDLLFCVAHDVSELRRIENAKRDFINMVSHDIRTPLSGMAIFLEMIPMGVYGQMNESGTSRANSLGGALNRIVAMVNDLLDIEKMQSGQFQIFKSAVDTNSLVKASLEMVQGYAEQQQIKLESRCDAISLACDESRIIQVLQNLMSNAVKFSEPGKTVTLNVVQEADVTRFEVIDQGKGIAKDDIPVLFDRFTQAKNHDGSKRQSGFGLGLAICKDIVERHGGKIGIISEVGVGSTFWFTIPNVDSST